ncbi:MAG: hypothetical protein GY802_27360, partial [Gammaproteobacteria bacterium]|nr:hypothetical protein [Gammaproteobacteria bacterium]
SRVEFSIDDELVRTDYNGNPEYFCYWNIVAVEDGSHTLDVIAYDTLGNTSEAHYTLNVALAPPPAPVITQPADGTVTNSATVQVTGTAVTNSEVILYHNGAQVGDALAVDTQGNFTLPATLTEGDNQIQALARYRNDDALRGPLSDPAITVSVDTTLPPAPTHLSAQSKEGG